MNYIGNSRFVVQGNRDGDGRRWAIFATDDRPEAERVLEAGITVDDRHWTGTNIHDRREALVPVGGWDH